MNKLLLKLIEKIYDFMKRNSLIDESEFEEKIKEMKKLV